MLVEHYITSQKRARLKMHDSGSQSSEDSFEQTSVDTTNTMEVDDRKIVQIGRILSVRYGLYGSEFLEKDHYDDEDAEDADEMHAQLDATRTAFFDIQQADTVQQMKREKRSSVSIGRMYNIEMNSLQPREPGKSTGRRSINSSLRSGSGARTSVMIGKFGDRSKFSTASSELRADPRDGPKLSGNTRASIRSGEVYTAGSFSSSGRENSSMGSAQNSLGSEGVEGRRVPRRSLFSGYNR